MKKTSHWIPLIATLLLTTVSCEKELFDQDIYNEFVDFQFMIDNVDREHMWCLTHSDTITLSTNKEEIYTVQILTANPYTSAEAEIAAEGTIYLNKQQTGYEATLAYTLPIVQNQAFIAIKDVAGTYLGVAPFTIGTDAIDLDQLAFEKRGTMNPTKRQTFSYVFDDGYPIPADFDYNDMVLRISKEYSKLSYQLYLTVSLEAVGTNKSYAGAIQLVGVNYDDVESVEIVDGTPMDEGYPFVRAALNSDKSLIKGRHGEAVVRLFENAHWAMEKELDAMGSVWPYIYNTERTEQEGRSKNNIPAVTRTYRINFRSPNVARDLSFDQIDPFIVQEYNGGFWETHTYAYKFSETIHSIYNGKQSYYDNHISWSIIIPKSDFRYTVEGMSLGTYNVETGEVFGPYTSFAEWMKDHTQNNDWYLRIRYPQLLY